MRKIYFLIIFSTFILNVADARAETRRNGRAMLKNPFKATSMFEKGFPTDFFPGSVEVLENEETAAAANTNEKNVEAATPPNSKAGTENATAAAPADPLEEKTRGPVFVGDYKAEDSLPPDQDPRVRLNKDAPAPFINMAESHMRGDRETAAKYADQYVRYQQNFFFEVRELTDLIGEALIRQKQIAEEDWDGVPQLIDYEFAKTRREKGDLFKPSHDVAMQRIKPDSRNQAEIYYFFNLNCAWCRFMAPDVERLYQAVKNDPNVKIVGLTMGPTSKDWMREYRDYTGLTLPVLEGERVAKSFNLKFVPALVVVAPNGKKAYLKSGAQSFDRMYEFVRKVQGLPMTVTSELKAIAALKIGAIENAKIHKGKNLDIWLRDENERAELERRLEQPGKTIAASTRGRAKVGKKVTLEKF